MIVRAIDPALIYVGERLRALNPDWVALLADEMARDGQQEAIRVFEQGDGFRLIAGHHRLAAALLLRWRTIDARIEAKDDFLEDAVLRLAEIKSDLMRVELTALDRGVYIATWSDIYTGAHELPKHGGDRQSGVPDFVDSLVEAAKRALNISKDTFYRALKIASIDAAQRQRLAGHPLADHQAQLLQLAAEPVDRQAAILDLILDTRQAESVADAIAILDETAPAPELAPYERLQSALARLPQRQRHALYALNEDEIRAWLAEADAARAAKRPKLRRVK